MKHRSRWIKKRILLPVVSLVFLGLGLTIALIRSNRSTIVVYNETTELLSRLEVSACGQVYSFSSISHESSVRVTLQKHGNPSPITLRLPGASEWKWQGSYIEPGDGIRLIIRLKANGEVTFHSQKSWWRSNKFSHVDRENPVPHYRWLFAVF